MVLSQNYYKVYQLLAKTFTKNDVPKYKINIVIKIYKKCKACLLNSCTLSNYDIKSLI